MSIYPMPQPHPDALSSEGSSSQAILWYTAGGQWYPCYYYESSEGSCSQTNPKPS